MAKSSIKIISFALIAATLLVLGACKKGPARTAIGSPGTASANGTYPNLTARAQELMDAVAQKNYAKMVDMTSPKAIEIGGGREKLLAATIEAARSMEDEEVVIISSTASSPTQIVNDASGIYAVVPVTTKIKAKDGTFQTEGSLIGISTDGGQNWTFVDATGKDQTELKQEVPVLDKLNLPAEKAPVKIAS